MPFSKIKLLALGYKTPHSGLTRVIQSILSNLDINRFEIHYAGIGKGQDMCNLSEITVHKHDAQYGDLFRKWYVSELLEKQHFDIIFMMNDFWIFEKYHKLLSKFQDKIKVITYTPIDGIIRDETTLSYFKNNAQFVAFTEFAKKEIERSVHQLKTKKVVQQFPEISILPHGIDTKAFYPLRGKPNTIAWRKARITAKGQVFGKHLAKEDAFIVLNANRAQPRKQIATTIEGFARFAVGKPANVKLCLHHAIMLFGEEKWIHQAAKKWGVQDRLILSTVNHGNEYFSDAQLNLLYNACDVGVNTSMGEGWGLISFEHGATGAAQIVPNHSACGELWKDAGLLLNPTETFEDANLPISFQKVSALDLAQHLERLYQDRATLEKWGLKAYQNATQPIYDWKYIGQQWSQLFENSLKQPKQEIAFV